MASDDLKAWYEQSGRPFVGRHLPTKIADFDAALLRIEAHQRRIHDELAICFLGDSGIGKSTLINALVAGKELVLPSGGIGPLTALAMEVRHGTEASFEAEYHASNKLRQLIFGLENGFRAQLEEGTGKEIVSGNSDFQLDPEEIESESVVTVEDQEDSARRARLESYRKQAQLMVKGNQDAQCELPYLLDCLREAVGSKRDWGTGLLPEDQRRVDRLRVAVGMGKEKRPHRVTKSSADQAFQTDLDDHATGFLAPLIKTINVTWPSPLLAEGIVLVDLPGVGVAGDVYKEVTRKWIFERAKAVVLVVGRAGVTDVAVDLLRTSDFLTRLLFSRDEQAVDPVVLAVAMSHLDDVAEDAWAKDRSKKKAEYLSAMFEQAHGQIRSHLRQCLERVWESGDEQVRKGQREVIERLVQECRTYPVSAPQYRRCLTQDADDPSFITDPLQSGIPIMQDGLRDTVRARRREATIARNEAIKAFLDQVATSARVIREQWSGGGHTEDEIKRLEADLEVFMAPLRKEFLVRQGQFRGFLKSTMPAHIQTLVGEAKDSARKEINRYLRSLKDAHWMTLKAAVRKEGTHFGVRAINLPEDFARKFVEPVAQVWGTSIVQKLRKETRDFAGDCESLVLQVAEWCRAQGARVPPKLLDAQVEAIRADIKQIDLAGRDIIHELREQVKNQLAAAIEKPIREKCRQFVRAGDHEGRGVKLRILELFDTLSEDATSAAANVAASLLLTRFKSVEAELRQVLKDLDDPLKTATDDILRSHRIRLERADTKNRDRVLAEVDQLLGSIPQTVLAEQ